MIAGFEVQGDVLLFGAKKLGAGQCPDNSKTGAAGPAGLTQLGHVKTDQRGRFIFPDLPAGKYKLVPHYEIKYTKFKVSPSSMELVVSSGPVKVTPAFNTVLGSYSQQVGPRPWPELHHGEDVGGGWATLPMGRTPP